MMSENGNLSAADVAAVVDGRNGYGVPYAVPAYNYGGGFGNGFGFGGDASWLIVLFLFAMMGGWGGNGFGGGNNQFPWMLANNTDTLVTSGFNNSNVTSLLGDIQNTIASGFATSQVANLNRSFEAQTAIDNHLDTLSMALQKCCCDNELATERLRFTVATEACADRAAVNDALRDVLTSNTANTQRILDQMCQDKIDAKNEKIADLERQLTMANLAASQTAQTGRILADNAAQTVALEQYLNPTPIPAYVVANPNCCNYGTGCGCGIGGYNGNF